MADYDPRLMRELREDDVDPFGGELIGLGEPDYRTTDLLYAAGGFVDKPLYDNARIVGL